MIEPAEPSSTPILAYTKEKPRDGVMRNGFLALILAFIGFPVGVTVSLFLDLGLQAPHWIAERGGFTVFAICEGLAAAIGVLEWRKKEPCSRGYRVVSLVAMLLGMIGIAVVLLLFIRGALQ